jgi:hypothetical protein
MFIIALFTIGKLWKQPRCPTTSVWIKKMWYRYTVEIYAAVKKNESHISQVVRGEVMVCGEPLRWGLPAPTALEERPPLPALLGFVCSIKPSTLARCALA